MNWEEIRKEYETTAITLKALAEKHGAALFLGVTKMRGCSDDWRR